MSRERQMKKALRNVAVLYAIALIVLTWAEISGRLSAREMALIGLLLGITAWIFLTVNFRTIARQYSLQEMGAADAADPQVRKKVTRSLRVNLVGLFIMPLLLINGLLSAKGAPPVSILVGILANLGLTWLFFKAYRTQRAKLEQWNGEGAANKNEHAGPRQ